MKPESLKVKIFIIIKMQSLKLHNNKDLDVIHNKKKSLHTCDIYYRGSGSVWLPPPDLYCWNIFFSLNLAPGFFHISKKEDFTVIWTLLTCLAFIGICKNAVTDVKKVMDVTNCRILFAVVGSSGYLLNSTALWNFWINVKIRIITLYLVDLF